MRICAPLIPLACMPRAGDKPQKVTQAEREKYRQEQKAKLEALSEEKRQELQHTSTDFHFFLHVFSLSDFSS